MTEPMPGEHDDCDDPYCAALSPAALSAPSEPVEDKPRVADAAHWQRRTVWLAAVDTLAEVATRTGSPAARWAAAYLMTDPDKRGPQPEAVEPEVVSTDG